MPVKLPDFQSQGDESSLRSGRTIASYDTTAIGKGAQDLGVGAQKLSRSLGEFADERTRKADDLNEARATAYYSGRKVDIDQAIKDATDADEVAKLKDEHKKLLDESATVIQDPTRREKWLLGRTPDLNRTVAAVDDRAFNINKDAGLAQDQATLDDLAKKFPAAQTPEDRAGIIRAAHDLIDKQEEAGFINAQEAQRRRTAIANGMAVNGLLARPPGERIAAVAGSGFEGSLIGSESGGNPRRMNGEGYTGLYQFGAPRLATLGVYAPGRGEDMSSSSAWSASPGRWTGTFNIPGFPQVKTIEDFRNNPDAQRAAFAAHTAGFDQEIAARGLDKYIGETVGGVPITKTAIYGMAHLGGIGGAEKFLTSGGKYNPADSNGTHLSDYASRFGNAPASQLAGYLTPDQRRKIEDGAFREIMVTDRAEEDAKRAEVANVRSLLKDDEASIMASGKPVLDLSRERVEKALGRDAADSFEKHRDAAVRYHDATNDWESIPAGEVRARLDSLKPTPGKAGYEAQAAYYNTAEARAKDLLRERQTDPAAAADRLPEVRAAKEQASLDHPESYQAVVKARSIGFDRLGIPEDMRVPITRDEARQLWRPIQLASPDEQLDVLKDTVKQLQTAFGDDADTALQFVLREGHADKQVREATSTVLRRLAKSEMPSREEARAVDHAERDAAVTQAVAPLILQQPVDPLTGVPMISPPDVKAAPKFPTPDPDAIAMLRGDPRLSEKFDAVYGAGSAKKVLEVARPRQTVSAN